MFLGKSKIDEQNQEKLASLCNQAMLYELGMGVQKDLQQALNLYREAEADGSKYAKEKVLELLKEGGLDHQQDEEQLHNTALDSILDLVDESSNEFDLLPSPKILIVDDSPDVLLILTKILSKRDTEVITAANAKEAFHLIAENPDIACAFIDLQMPEINGFSLIETLKKKNILQGVPIIVETAYTSKELLDMGIKLGIKGWVKKPLEAKKVLEVFDQLVEVEE